MKNAALRRVLGNNTQFGNNRRKLDARVLNERQNISVENERRTLERMERARKRLQKEEGRRYWKQRHYLKTRKFYVGEMAHTPLLCFRSGTLMDVKKDIVNSFKNYGYICHYYRCILDNLIENGKDLYIRLKTGMI